MRPAQRGRRSMHTALVRCEPGAAKPPSIAQRRIRKRRQTVTTEAELYRRKAEACLARARSTNNPVMRVKLLAIAKQWIALAEQEASPSIAPDQKN